MSRAKLGYGETTIDRAAVVDAGDGVLRLQWWIRLKSGQTKRYTTKMKTRYKSDVRARAKAKAAELLASERGGAWSPSDQISEFVRRESIEAIRRNEFARPLRPNSQERYVHVLELFAQRTQGFCISDAMRARTLIEVFRGIARDHGTATAKKASQVVSKYVARRLVTDGVIEYNPLRDIDLELPQHVAKVKPQGGQALTPEERERVIEHLLALDPSQPKRGRYTAAERTAKRALCIDVTLTQAVTGMRIGEVRHLTLGDVDLAAEPLRVSVTSGVSKTHIGRTVPVLDDRVAERVRARCEGLTDASAPVFGAPAAPASVWDSANAQKALKALYRELADACDVPLLSEVSTHVWRASLNTLWMQAGIPVELRAAYLGHGEDVNRASYTDTGQTDRLIAMLESAKLGNHSCNQS